MLSSLLTEARRDVKSVIMEFVKNFFSKFRTNEAIPINGLMLLVRTDALMVSRLTQEVRQRELAKKRTLCYIKQSQPKLQTGLV